MEEKIDLWIFDRGMLKGHSCLSGVDEAGRGPLAGPVVAAAVTLTADVYDHAVFEGLDAVNDSKKLNDGKRREIHARALELANDKVLRYAVAECGVADIEKYNILGATKRAMAAAVETIRETDSLLLVDGRPLKGFPFAHEALVGGDRRSFVIALASIFAKVHRDNLMDKLHARYPIYGFAKHKGYGTREHREAIIEHGPCPEHRSLFLRKILSQ